MKQWGLENVGRFYGEHHEPNIITCCTVQSAHHLDKLLPKFKAVIADEIHMLSNDTGIGTFKKLKGASVRLAVSATPFKHGGKDEVQMYTIKGYFGPVLKVDEKIIKTGILTTNFLQERGTVSESNCIFYKVTEPKIPYDIFIDAVTNGIANNWHFHHMVERLAKNLKGRTLILVDRIVHGDILHRSIPGSLWVSGKDNTETRGYVIEQMQKATNDVVAIATQQIFSVGINFFVHNMINAAGGQAEHEIIQRMGRGLRTANDKVILNYYDFIFEINPYLDDHSQHRIKILRKEGHPIIIKDKVEF
jgi:superfamily II DNA or RNA helicase